MTFLKKLLNTLNQQWNHFISICERYPKITAIITLVLIWHIALYQALGIQLPKPYKVVRPHKIAVETVKLKPKPTPPPKKTTPKKSSPKKKKTSEQPKKKIEKKKPEAKKEEPPSVDENLLNDLRKNLESIERRNELAFDIPKTEIKNFLGSTPTPEISSTEESFNLSDPADLWYREELIKRLKLYLKLPEESAVHLELTLRKDGSIERLHILSSPSIKNKQYVESKLPAIPFPKFGKQMSQHETRIFPLILESN